MGVSTRQKDGGPANPAKRLQPRPGAASSKPATPATPEGGPSRPAAPAPSTRASFLRGSGGSPVATVVTKPTEESNDILSRLRKGFNDIRAEVMKVTWPNREELRNLTIVVIGISAGVGVVLGLLDVFLGEAVRFLTTGNLG
jgi:preprotein translocase SecE subunit